MKILTLLLVLLALFRETRHQFPIFYPPFSISLANEEFIQPSPIVGDSAGGNVRVDVPPEHHGEVDSKPSTSIPEYVEVEQQTPAKHDSTNKGNLRQGDFPNIPPPSTSTTPMPTQQDLQSVPTTNPLLEAQNVEGKPVDVENTESGHAYSTNENANVIEAISGTGEGNVADGSPTQKQPTPGPVVIDEKKKDEEEPIPSYMEWAQKKQMELISNSAGQNGHSGSPNGNGHGNHQGQGHNGQPGQAGGNNGSSATSTSSGKNFASPDCGAKVVQSNAESQNPSGVLSSSHDEYMLNKCGTTIWFVVELCEPVTIERISIGNLELFSSSPKEVEFGISDRYPTRDWVKLGPFTLPDARSIHPVVLPATNASTFGKFVKFSVHSHHGSEHYCPISVIQVNGKSEYEVLESETTHLENENKEGGALYEEPIEEQTQSSTEGGKIGGLKDAVLNMLNKAVQSIVKRAYSFDSQDSSESDLLLKSQCRSVLQCVPHSHMTHDIYRLLSCNSSNVLPFLAAHSHWCGWDYCHATFESRSIGSPWQPEGFYASLFGGSNVLHALCHYLKPLTDGCDPTCLAMHMNSTLHKDVSEYTNESLTSDNITVGAFPVNHDLEAQIPRTISGQESQEEQQELPNPTSGILGTTQSTVQQQQQQMETPPVNPSGTVPQLPPTASNPPPPQQHHQQQQETQIPPPSPMPAEDIPYMQQGGGQPQQKESVFVRLTNRIKNLERNQSLTASYLEELSKRFKKQNEDNSLIVETNKKIFNETRVKVFQLDEFYRQESQSLRRNLDDVREKLFNVQLQRSLLVIICLSQTVLIIGAVIWCKKKFAGFQQQLECLTPLMTSRRQTLTDVLQSYSVVGNPEKRRESDPSITTSRLRCGSITEDSHVQHMVTRKRSNSDSLPSNEKAKRLRKKNRKQLTNVTTIPKPTNSKSHSDTVATNTIKALNDDQDFQFKMPKSRSGDGFFDVPSAPVNQRHTAPFTPKENVDPQFARNIPPNLSLSKSRNLFNSNSNSPTFQPRLQTLQQPQLPTTLLTKVDSPFTFQSQISPFPDSGISTSSRFALLASPVRDSHSPTPNSSRQMFFAPSVPGGGGVPSSVPYSRSGSTESSGSAISNQSGSGSLSLNSGTGDGLKGTINGHRKKDSRSVSSNDSTIPASAMATNSQGKDKGKRSGLKAFMPKIFDR